jgi:hypothetical protein
MINNNIRLTILQLRVDAVIAHAIYSCSFAFHTVCAILNHTFSLKNERESMFKIAGSGFDFGKSSPLTICKYCVTENVQKTRSIVTLEADEARISCIPSDGVP